MIASGMGTVVTYASLNPADFIQNISATVVVE